EDRRLAALPADGVVGDERGAGRERGVQQGAVGGELVEGEHRLAASRLAVFGGLQLLHLDDQLAVPGVAQPRSGLRIGIVIETDAGAGARLDDDTGKRSDRRRRQRDARLAVLYLAGYADTHSRTSAGPR